MQVDTLNKVLRMFRHIYIAPTDKLFVNGQEITKEQSPRIFKQKNTTSATPEQFDILPF